MLDEILLARRQGYLEAVDEIKNILKSQPFMKFNVNEQYSIRPIISSKERDSFLKDVLDWVFQSSLGKVNEK